MVPYIDSISKNAIIQIKFMKFNGLLLEESLTNSSVLDLVTILKTEKWEADNASPIQPKIWTAIHFEGEDSQLNNFLDVLSKSLKPLFPATKIRLRPLLIFST